MRSPAPAVELVPGNIPLVLRERARWLNWMFLWKETDWSKHPINPHTGGGGSSTNPRAWTTFDHAVRAFRAHPDRAGVGYVFVREDGLCGLDLDDCIYSDGQLVPEAAEIVAAFNTYTEISPSGTGLKLFLKGTKPAGAGCKSKAIKGFKEIEIYDCKRYFTVTGAHWPGTPLTVEPRQAQLDALCRRLWLPKSARPPSAPSDSPFNGDDEALIAKACSARNGHRFRRLWEGDTSMHGEDDSAADMALSTRLAFWTGRDASRMDALFRRSGLYREKWDEKRGAQTYGQRTIAKAIECCTEVYKPKARARVSVSAPGDSSASDGAERQEPEEASGLVPLGHRDPETGRLVLSPLRTLPTAQAYVREFHQHPVRRTILTHSSIARVWKHNRYVQVEDAQLKAQLHPWLDEALQYRMRRGGGGGGGFELVDFPANPTTVNKALESIKNFTFLPADTPSPSWLQEPEDDLDPLEILSCRSMNVHLPTGAAHAATPAFFTTSALDFDYDPQADIPEKWMWFLEFLFGDDIESVELLQDWFGYALTPDTRQQKILLVVGPRRSGKGTIGRVLTQLVGPANVVGPTTGSLAGGFGLQPLIDKSLAVVSDARFRGENVSTVIERLLCISGEDTVTVDRKHMGSVSLKLPTRFMFLTNELPRLPDSSAALAGRFLVLKLNRSVYDREDPDLTGKLNQERPGILNWAIGGWKRLRQRGRFIQPRSSAGSVNEMEDLSSPVGAFVREHCTVGPGHRAVIDDLYAAWTQWCECEGRNIIPDRAMFGRDLMAAFSGIHRRRGSSQVPFYEGIALRGVGAGGGGKT